MPANAAPENSAMDYCWAVWFVLHTASALCVDLVLFYPPSLYRLPGSPLHFLQRLRDYSVDSYNDPFVALSPHEHAALSPRGSGGRGTWVLLAFYLELAVELPILLHGIWQLAVHRAGTARVAGRRGAALEMLYMLYALVTAFTTVQCMFDIAVRDDGIYSPDMKRTFLVNMYGPFAVVPAVMAVDMANRILGRVGAADALLARKKKQ